MDARPIVLVPEDMANPDAFSYIGEYLETHGYVLLVVPRDAIDAIRVCPPHAFTPGDVAALRSMAAAERRENGEHIDEAFTLDAIASRIEALL